MRTLTILALSLPFGGEGRRSAPPETWSRYEIIGGLTALVGPADVRIGFGGVTSTMPVRVAGGEGSLTYKAGLTRDVSVVVRDADVKAVAGLFDLPKWLDGKLRGRVGLVTLDVKGDTFALKASGFRIPGDPLAKVEAVGDLKARTVKVKAFALGGVLEYDGRLPGE